MPTQLSKTASEIPIRVGVRHFDGINLIDEWDTSAGPSLHLGDKILEYLVRIGESNDFCFNIIVQLLTQGKVRVDFRDSTERLILVNKNDIMSRSEAVQVFDHWVDLNRPRLEACEDTRKVVLELPRTQSRAIG